MSAHETNVGDIGQVAITVSDVAAAKAFYCDVLGLRFLFDAGPNLAFVAAGAIRVMLTTAQGHGTVGHNSTLYFRVHDIVAAYGSICERGAKAEREPELTARMPDHETFLRSYCPAMPPAVMAGART